MWKSQFFSSDLFSFLYFFINQARLSTCLQTAQLEKSLVFWQNYQHQTSQAQGFNTPGCLKHNSNNPRDDQYCWCTVIYRHQISQVTAVTASLQFVSHVSNVYFLFHYCLRTKHQLQQMPASNIATNACNRLKQSGEICTSYMHLKIDNYCFYKHLPLSLAWSLKHITQSD